jgi:hypothetical protein
LLIYQHATAERERAIADALGAMITDALADDGTNAAATDAPDDGEA